jgi:hypothetical protein
MGIEGVAGDAILVTLAIDVAYYREDCVGANKPSKNDEWGLKTNQVINKI